MASKVVKMCDMPRDAAAKVFEELNRKKVKVERYGEMGYLFIVTDTEPRDLIYPEGWYYAKGTLRNKHKSSTGCYSEIPMYTSNDESWHDLAKYCTLDD